MITEMPDMLDPDFITKDINGENINLGQGFSVYFSCGSSRDYFVAKINFNNKEIDMVEAYTEHPNQTANEINSKIQHRVLKEIITDNKRLREMIKDLKDKIDGIDGH